MKLIKLLFATTLFITYSALASIPTDYNLYQSESDYYLKASTLWVPVGVEHIIFVPGYQGLGEYIKLENIDGTWYAINITQSEFNSVSLVDLGRSNVSNISSGVSVTLSNSTIILRDSDILNTSYGTYYISYSPEARQRRVVFIHTDLLGSPVAETLPDSFITPERPSEANILLFLNIRVSWSSVIGATEYKVELIRGRNCGQIIQTQTTTSLNSQFFAPSSGDYAARVSACAGNCSLPTMTSWVYASSGTGDIGDIVTTDVECTL